MFAWIGQTDGESIDTSADRDPIDADICSTLMAQSLGHHTGHSAMMSSLFRDESFFPLIDLLLRRFGTFLESRIVPCSPRDLEPDALFFSARWFLVHVLCAPK